jgi:phosphoribosyl 1,2-cyclic phosphodiesterase
MKRRDFLKKTTGLALAAGAAGALSPAELLANDVLNPAELLAADAANTDNTLKIRFLGTGAAGGKGSSGKGRRHSSILVDNSFIIDFTDDSLDMLPEGARTDTIFYTHSHIDHFQPSAALKIGVKRVYLNHSWYDVAVKAYRQAASEAGAEMPEIIPTYAGVPVVMGDVTVTPLIANHPTSNLMEESQIFLLQKGGVRLLYATDTSGIPGRSARIAGIDAHKEAYGITALIMEATMADPEDFRLYCHSSTATVANTVRVLLKTGRLHMPEGQKVYLTHIASSLHPKDINAGLPEPLQTAEDGMEVVFREP